ncbi:hypothetical protein AVEN_145092-1 [Araneus ventricosus]|uniref:Secreted protein n=1 Tax=Araneus ventricosus TaxID=182803 RepID=A0A4Y2QMW9_ARAVE|nr:hypothetical protein AVEN_145092-1 [Araneus ventricosus]
MDTYSQCRWSVVRSVVCVVVVMCVCVQLCDSETRIFTAGQWDGTGEENEYYYASDRNSILETPKYLVKESSSRRCVPIKCVPISTLACSRTSRIILPRAQIATGTHEHGESDDKKRQAGVNKYRAQKIASSTHARGDSGFVGDAIIQTDRQSTRSRIWPKI